MKRLIVPIFALAIAASLCSPLLAEGLIRINPSNPVMLGSPATFTVDVQSGGPVTEPHIFLVMTEDCFDGLTGNVIVTWTGGSLTIFTATDWQDETDNSVKVPPGATSVYTVSSLKDHLSTSGKVYWAFEPFLSGPITTTPQSFTVHVPSTNVRVLVYVLGKGPDSTVFDYFVPPTIPGFVTPEVATILLVIAPLCALGLYAVKRRKK